MPDIMMMNGDIGSNIFGDIMIVDYDEDIVQSAINNILLIFGEYQFHPTLGNMVYRRKNKLSPSNLKIIEADCRNAIINDPRVHRVTYINAVRNPNAYGACDVSFELQTVGMKLLSSRITVIVKVV